jgi:hypothetical protein
VAQIEVSAEKSLSTSEPFFVRSELTSLHSIAYTELKPEDLLARNQEIKFEGRRRPSSIQMNIER